MRLQLLSIPLMSIRQLEQIFLEKKQNHNVRDNLEKNL